MREGSSRRKERAMAKVPPAMWEKPEAFEDTPGEPHEHEGVIDDIVGHSEVKDHGDHEHGPECGHESSQHGDHIDYVHGRVRHFSHEGHWDRHE